MQELNVFHFSEMVNQRGVPVDQASVDKLVIVASELNYRIRDQVQQLTDGKVSSGSAVNQAIKYINECGVGIEDLKASTVKEYLDFPENSLPPKVKALLEYRRIVSRSSTKKFAAIQETIGDDGRVHGLMFYHGAHTGRWTSRLLQIHNLPRGVPIETEVIAKIIDSLHTQNPNEFLQTLEDVYSQYGNVADILATLIRPMIQASAGHKLMVYDYASIEARVLAWLAGCTQLIKAFENGEDVYKLMASEIYNKPVAEITKEERQLGKATILGCGYGMGPKKFVDAAKMYGIEIQEATSKHVVDTYRNTYSEIVQLWNDTGNAFQRALCNKDQHGVRQSANQGIDVSFFSNRNFTFCKLPSGRHLSYPFADEKDEANPHTQQIHTEMYYMGEGTHAGSWVEKKVYGAKLIENVVQAIARDLMVDAMLNLEQAGIPIIFSVHDEIVAEVKTQNCSPHLFEDIMRTPPKWAKNLPIDVEGYTADRYRK